MTSNERSQSPRGGSLGSSRLLRAKEIPGYAFGDDRVDVRGWRVYTSDAELVGAVESLFVDIRTKAVRYLGVSINDRRTGLPTGSVLVPIGAAARPGDRHVIVLSRLSSVQLAAAPRVPDRPITRGDEDATLAVYGMPPTTETKSGDPYDSPMFAEERLFHATYRGSHR